MNMNVKRYSTEAEEVKQDLASASQNAKDLGRSVANDAKNFAETALEQGKEHYANIKDVVTDRAHEALEKGKDGLKMVEERVRETPTKSVLMAFGAGMLAAFLLGRR